ncbi:MAG: hypothetical protein ACFE9S_02675 [Candidatus Hermodarchaeota archaeon]
MNQRLKIFMLMPYRGYLNSIYEEHIKKPLISMGHKVTRADDISKSTNILTDILDLTRRSDIIIADLTEKNPNVFYELGIAHEKGKWVIQICQEGEKIPFDLAQIRTIFYRNTPDDLKILTEKIIRYIESYTKEQQIKDWIRNLKESKSFADSIYFVSKLLKNEDFLTSENIREIARATINNYQIYNSAKLRNILPDFFKRHQDIIPNIIKDDMKYYGWIA